MSSPVDIVQQLHDLVDETYTTSESKTPFELCRSKLTISEMCRKLIRAVEGPRAYSAELSVSCQESAALNLIVSLGIADLIASSKDQQLTLKDLSEKTGAAEEYLMVCMNLLLHHGYFIEVGGFGSRLYQNNEFSDVLRNGGDDVVTVKEFVGLCADDGARASTSILEAATQPPPADGEFKRSAHNHAFNTSIPVFHWMAIPGNEWRLERTGKAMIEASSIFMRGAAEDYSWDTLPSPLIDLGGGMGALEMMVLTSSEKNRNLKFVILDLEKTVEKCKELWEHKPAWMKNNVSFIAGDFMQNDPAQSKIPVPSSRQTAGTYFIRHALTNWSDDDVVKILTNIVDAIQSSPSSGSDKSRVRILLVELLTSAEASRFCLQISISLLTLSAGYCRTVDQIKHLVNRVGKGLKVDRVVNTRDLDTIIELSV